MNSEWPVVRLSDHVESSLGKMLDKMKNKGMEHPYLGNSNVRWGHFDLTDLSEMKFEDSESDRYGIKNGDLIICEGGEPGRCAIWKEYVPDMKIQKALHRVRPKPTLNNYYLYYWFLYSGSRGTLEPYFTGTTIKHLTGKALKDLEIQLPPLVYQEYVAKVMKSLDDKIELNRQTNQTLEQIAQAIFKSWFVDFEPVKAKIAAKQNGQNQELAAMCTISGKTEEQLKVLDEAALQQLKTTAALFPDALVESKLGKIPEGWGVKSLDEIAHYQNGLALQKFRPENENEYLPVLKISQLKKGFADCEEKASSNIKPECIVDNGDVVFSWSGSLMVDAWCGGRVALNQHLFKVTSDKYPKWFFYYWTKRHLESFQQIAADKAVTMGHIKREHLSQAKCLIPGDLSNIDMLSDVLEKQIEQRIENFTLQELRDTLLPKLLSGELKTNNAT